MTDPLLACVCGHGRRSNLKRIITRIHRVGQPADRSASLGFLEGETPDPPAHTFSNLTAHLSASLINGDPIPSSGFTAHCPSGIAAAVVKIKTESSLSVLGRSPLRHRLIPFDAGDLRWATHASSLSVALTVFISALVATVAFRCHATGPG